MSNSAYEAIRSVDSLPSPDEVAWSIVRVARDPNSTIRDIATIVQRDPATAGRILKYVNSPYVGIGQKVSTLQQAITLLGMRCVVNLSLGYSLVSKYLQGRCENFDYHGYWSDALARAVTVRHLSQRHGLIPNETFTCGLLSQIGRLALASVYPAEYSQLLAHLDPSQPDALTEIEREAFELDHNELTARMIEDWSLPGYFGEAVRAQDAPDEHKLTPATRASQLAHLLHLCGMLSPIFQNRDLHRHRLTNLLMAADRALISPECFTQTFEDVTYEWQEMGTLFDIEIQNEMQWGQLYADASAAAHAANRFPQEHVPAVREGRW